MVSWSRPTILGGTITSCRFTVVALKLVILLLLMSWSCLSFMHMKHAIAIDAAMAGKAIANAMILNMPAPFGSPENQKLSKHYLYSKDL